LAGDGQFGTISPSSGTDACPLPAAHKFEQLFRKSAGLDVDKADIARYQDFINRKLYDLLLMAQATAKANNYIAIEPHGRRPKAH
jgi:hypothetical protein